MKEIAVGIDLGTTYSVVAWVDELGHVNVVRNPETNLTTTPSAVYVGQDPPLVGQQAKELLAAGEGDGAVLFKREMGNPNYQLFLAGDDYDPTRLSGILLRYLKQMAEDVTGRSVTKAVVTVPAYFDNPQREATIRAGESAGLVILQIINEPTAAAFAYGVDKMQGHRKLLVYDLGGGTFDVTLVELKEGEFNVIATEGNHQLGGNDWDNCIVDWIDQQYQTEHGVSPKDDEVAAAEMQILAENAKKQLTELTSTRISFSFDGLRLKTELSREQFETMTSSLMARTEALCQQVLEDAEKAFQTACENLLVEWIDQRFQSVHGISPLDDDKAAAEVTVAAETASKKLSANGKADVVLTFRGKAWQESLSRDQFETQHPEVRERRMDWKALDGVLLVGGSTRMPMVTEYVKRMSGKDPITGVNVDEAVAIGAALQAARKSEIQTSLSLPGRVRDVMSHSLGMIAESAEGDRYVNSIIIKKNQRIPRQDVRPYQLDTQPGNGNELEVYMTQGERSEPQLVKMIGKYAFRGIAHGTRGMQVLDVSYAYDENGVVKITATERETQRTLTPIVEPLPDDMSWLDLPPRRRSSSEPVTAYLAFDLSGSMWGAPLEEAQRAAREFISQSDLSKCSLGVVEFADSNHTAQPACQNAKDVERAIDAMKIGARVGGGNMASPFAHTHELLKGRSGPRFIIVLTDGVWSYQDVARAEARACHQDGIEVIAIGFGYADKQFLADVATSETGSFFTSLNELVTTFGSIAREITETAGGQRTQGSKLRFLRAV